MKTHQAQQKSLKYYMQKALTMMHPSGEQNGNMTGLRGEQCCRFTSKRLLVSEDYLITNFKLRITDDDKVYYLRFHNAG